MVGTGNAGRVLLVERSGAVRKLFAAPEPEIFALWADPDGTVFAGSSPAGKVYRIPAGGDPPAPEAAVFFDPGETYIWALARDAEGRLLVATGTEGRLYRVAEGGAGELVYDGDDAHLRALLPLPGGEFAGTVTVDLASGPLQVDVPVTVAVREETPAAIILDLNALEWLSLAQVVPGVPPVGRVTSAAFQQALGVTVE